MRVFQHCKVNRLEFSVSCGISKLRNSIKPKDKTAPGQPTMVGIILGGLEREATYVWLLPCKYRSQILCRKANKKISGNNKIYCREGPILENIL